MAGETPITVVGNLTADPELRYTQSGTAVASFTVASTPRRFNKQTNQWEDGEALFLRCNLWREPAENLANSNIVRGTRVVVTGSLTQRTYDTQNGEKRTVIELRVDEVAPSVRYATVQVNRVQRSQGGGQQQNQQGGGQQGGGQYQGQQQGGYVNQGQQQGYQGGQQQGGGQQMGQQQGMWDQGGLPDEPPF